MRVHRAMVGKGYCIALVIIVRLPLCLTADNMTDGVDADIAPMGAGALADILDMSAAIIQLGKG